MDTPCLKVDFRKVTGNVISHPRDLISIGHTALVPPWSDPALHQHSLSEEYYLLLKGQMNLVVGRVGITLQPNEILFVKPNVPHAVIGGAGSIEYFGIRAPALHDKQVVSELTEGFPFLHEDERLISAEWGYRIPLDLPQHTNRWLIGAGSALYPSEHLILAYLNFLTQAAANAGIGTRHQLHLHQKSWEYYIVLQGEKVLLVEREPVPLHAGEMLVIPPNVNHTLFSRQAPFLGFTMRVPVELNDKVVVETK